MHENFTIFYIYLNIFNSKRNPHYSALYHPYELKANNTDTRLQTYFIWVPPFLALTIPRRILNLRPNATNPRVFLGTHDQITAILVPKISLVEAVVHPKGMTDHVKGEGGNVVATPLWGQGAKLESLQVVVSSFRAVAVLPLPPRGYRAGRRPRWGTPVTSESKKIVTNYVVNLDKMRKLVDNREALSTTNFF